VSDIAKGERIIKDGREVWRTRKASRKSLELYIPNEVKDNSVIT
jgi:hypothetical protein